LFILTFEHYKALQFILWGFCFSKFQHSTNPSTFSYTTTPSIFFWQRKKIKKESSNAYGMGRAVKFFWKKFFQLKNDMLKVNVSKKKVFSKTFRLELYCPKA
jgi:hypothetical protein